MNLPLSRGALYFAASATLVAASWTGGSWANESDGNSAAAGRTSLSAKPSLEEQDAVMSQRVAASGLRYRSKMFQLGAGQAGGGSVGCGPGGYRAVGGGVQTPTLQEIVNETRPYDSPRGDTTPDNGWIAYIINPAGNDISYRVYVICKG